MMQWMSLSPPLLALLAGLGTWTVTALGAATVFLLRGETRNVQNWMLGFAAGVMIAASFWSLLAPAIELAEEALRLPAWLVATLGFLGGALCLYLSDRAVSRAGKQLENGAGSGLGRIRMLLLSITLHNIPEGLAVGVAFGALEHGPSPEGLLAAASVALGIGIQNYPEGAAVSLPLRREGYSARKSFLYGQASAMVEPISALLGALLVLRVRQLLPFALAFAAGAMILVAVHELIPECQTERSAKPYLSTVGIVTGFAVMMLLDVALG